jgi:hypothetical protein
MEFPLVSNDTTMSLFRHAPAVATPYIVVVSLASVAGTLGNLLVIGTLCCSVRFRNRKNVGNIFIINLSMSDLIVTAIINPIAVSGQCFFRISCESR